MVEDPEDPSREEMSGWLRRWAAPAASPRLDDRVLASYRAVFGASRWSRLWRARVSIPLPVVALLAAAMLAGAAFVLRGHADRGTGGSESAVAGSTGLANLRPLPEVRVRVVRRDANTERSEP